MARRNSNKINKEEQSEIVEEIVKEEPKIIEEPKEINGEVINCDSLNVRENPKTDSKILGTINKTTIVKIIDSSDSEFYQIKVDKIIGYCMKKYITIKE